MDITHNVRPHIDEVETLRVVEGCNLLITAQGVWLMKEGCYG